MCNYLTKSDVIEVLQLTSRSRPMQKVREAKVPSIFENATRTSLEHE